MGTALLVVGGLIVLVFIWVIATYNRLVGLKNQIDNAWAQIDVQLKKRYDLIPNLVETVKGYAAHEKEVFENVAAARSAMMQAQGVEAQAQAQNQITQALKSLFAVAEAYPELKANENFAALQQQLSATENSIAQSREIYNNVVAGFNTIIQSFPSSIIASSFGFTRREYFPMEDAAREAPKVRF
ncbi:MAG: LemA family protein [Armatimonadota bacterium]